MKANEVYVGDLLISRLAEPAGRCILAPDLSCKMVTAVDVAIIRKSKDYNSYYLMSYLNTDYNFYNVSNLATGSTRKRISRKNLETIFIPIPSLPEQEKIGSFLSKIDERIELEEKKLELFKERKRGWMQKLFNQEIRFKDEDGNGYPDWEEKKLGELFSLIRNGVNIRQFGNKGIPITRIESISKGYLNVNKLGYASIMDDSYEDYYLKEGDILFSHINSVKHIGKMAYIQKNFNIIHGMNLLLLRTINNNSCFLFYYLSNDKIKHQYTVLAKPAVNQASLSISELKNIDIVIPSLPEQQKIADFLSKQDELISAQEKKISLLKEQKKGLLQQMFV